MANSWKLPKNEDMCIVNNKAKGEGEHWVAFYRHKNNIYMNDSYGRTPVQVNKTWVNIKHMGSRKPEQSYSLHNPESDCGSRSMSFLVTLAKWGLNNMSII